MALPPTSSRYAEKRRVGKGAYGEVWCAIDTENNERVAIKKLDYLPDDDELLITRVMREILVMDHLSHPNIMPIYNAALRDDGRFTRVHFTMPYMDCDLGRLCEINNSNVSGAHIKYIMYQLLLAVDFMHRSGIVHRDIKPPNILINTDCKTVLCDMGLARGFDINENSLSLSNLIQTRWYRAPEVSLQSTTITSKVDVWSVGCVFVELFTGTALFKGKTDLDQVNILLSTCGVTEELCAMASMQAFGYITKCGFPAESKLSEKLGALPPLARDLAKRMLCVDPDSRISAGDALRHPYFIDWFSQDDILEASPFDISYEKRCTSRDAIKEEIASAIDRIKARNK